MGGLMAVIRAANVLNGERHAPELPIPYSAIEAYAEKKKMSGIFMSLVREYDLAVISGAMEKIKNGAGKATKTSQKIL